MLILRLSSVLMVILVFVSSVFMVATFAAVAEDTVTSAISKAEGVLVSAYQAVREANQAGANVSSLLVRLSDAEEFLAKARMAYKLGDFDEAVRSADLCYEIGERVKNEAAELRFAALGPWVMGFWLRITGSMVGVLVVVFGSFMGWSAFKRRYYTRVLRMKPEVSSNES